MTRRQGVQEVRKPQFPIYNLDPEIRRRVEESARHDRRTLSQQMQTLMKEALDARDTKNQGGKP